MERGSDVEDPKIEPDEPVKAPDASAETGRSDGERPSSGPREPSDRDESGEHAIKQYDTNIT